MKTVTFFGSSDDIVCVDGFGRKDINGRDIDNLYNDDAYLVLRDGLSFLGVKAKYSDFGCWHFFPFILNEDLSLLPAECQIKLPPDTENDYTTELVLQVPEHTTITVVDDIKEYVRTALRLREKVNSS